MKASVIVVFAKTEVERVRAAIKNNDFIFSPNVNFMSVVYRKKHDAARLDNFRFYAKYLIWHKK